MRVGLLALSVLAAALVLVPGDEAWRDAFRKSPPHAEAEEYFLRREADPSAAADALRERVRIRRLAGDREGEAAGRRRLAELDPGDADNWENLRRLHTETGRLDQALEAAERLVRLRPGRVDLRHRLLELYEWSGRPAGAKAHAEWLAQRGARTARMARVFFAAKDVDGLASVVASPRDRAVLLTAMGMQEPAIACWREHLAGDPADFAARRALVQLFVWNGRHDEAMAELEAWLALDDDPEARRELVELGRAIGRIDLIVRFLPESAEKGDFLLALGRVDEARDLFERLGLLDKLLSLSLGMPDEEEEIRVRERMPMTEENLDRLAALYCWRKEFARALALYEKLGDDRVIDLHLALGDRKAALEAARRFDIPGRLGELYFWEGRLEEAVEQFVRVPEMRNELPRLYILMGRRDDALRLLDVLEATMNPYVRAELYVYAGCGDRAFEILEGLGDALDLERATALAEAAEGDAAVRLYRLLLRFQPGHRPHLLALADLLEGLGRRDEAVAILRSLVELDPRDAWALARLGLLLNDWALLERARAAGSRDPDVLRALADFAYGERRWKDAIALLREYLALREGDYHARFLLAELTGDPAEYERTWRRLPAGERAVRLRILIWRKDLDGALALVGPDTEAYLREALADLLIEAGRDAAALSLGLTVRQRAVLALRRGRYEEALALFRTLDVEDLSVRRSMAECLLALGRLTEADALVPGISLRHRAVLALKAKRYEEAIAILRRLDADDPDVRRSLAEALLALGRWQEAEPYAEGDLLRDIRGRYGPEASAQSELYAAEDERRWTVAARTRLQLSQEVFFRLEGKTAAFEGDVTALADDVDTDVQRAELDLFWERPGGLKLGAGIGAWDDGEGDDGFFGTGEIELRRDDRFVLLLGTYGEPWMESVETVAAEGVRDRLELQAGYAPARFLYLSGAGGYSRYRARDPELEGETASELRFLGRGELRLWTSDVSVGRGFFDAPLRHESGIQGHAGVMVQVEVSETFGSEDLLLFTQRLTSSRLVAAGPTAAWADRTWGIAAQAFAAGDSERDLAFGRIWGASAQVVAILADRWKAGSSLEFISEQREITGGEAWSWIVGLHYNF